VREATAQKSNAGKSTLLNKLTGAGVLAEDKLFATLDPTTRRLRLPTNQNVLLTDTVGFIRKLPHTLVEAFEATLEEVVLPTLVASRNAARCLNEVNKKP
jgi:GTP-binding protein HflX